MKWKHTTKKSQTDWDRFMIMKDEEIDYSDIPDLRVYFFNNAHVRLSIGWF